MGRGRLAGALLQQGKQRAVRGAGRSCLNFQLRRPLRVVGGFSGGGGFSTIVLVVQLVHCTGTSTGNVTFCGGFSTS
jgi:hypothetical protein